MFILGVLTDVLFKISDRPIIKGSLLFININPMRIVCFVLFPDYVKETATAMVQKLSELKKIVTYNSVEWKKL